MTQAICVLNVLMDMYQALIFRLVSLVTIHAQGVNMWIMELIGIQQEHKNLNPNRQRYFFVVDNA